MNRWVRRAGWALACWGVLVGYAEVSDRHFTILGLAPVALAVTAVGWLWLDTSDVMTQPEWRPYRHFPQTRTFDARFTRLCQDVSEVETRPAAVDDIKKSLRLVATELAEPVSAGSTGPDLGPSARAFLAAAPTTDKSARRTTPEEFIAALDPVLDRLEQM